MSVAEHVQVKDHLLSAPVIVLLLFLAVCGAVKVVACHCEGSV